MKIERIQILNFKSIESLEIRCHRFYTAICGKNNAGKTTIFTALRSIFDQEEYDPFEDETNNFIKDFPWWKKNKDNNHESQILIELKIDSKSDAGIYKFIQKFALEETKNSQTPNTFLVELSRNIDCDKNKEVRGVSINNQKLIDKYEIEEIHKKFRSSKTFTYHNSTQPIHPYRFRRDVARFFGEVSPEDKEKLNESKSKLMKAYEVIAKKHKKDIEDTLGRLEDKYQVGISIPEFDPEVFPFSLTLVDKKMPTGLPLSAWGSGTQNRTKIFMALLRAKKIIETSSESDKITPFMLIEEPECFLHPSAQAEFGSALQDLSEEFNVQVICTTHSPYMLNLEHPESNILLSRVIDKGQERETKLIQTSQQNWMEPFSLSLGLDNSAFDEWKNLLVRDSGNILLVEGHIDKEYFDLLKNPHHGSNALNEDIEVVPYGGSGLFAHDTILKFFLNRFKSSYVTFDLDAKESAEKLLRRLSLTENKDFISIGTSLEKCIEGLLPRSIKENVTSTNYELMQLLINGDNNEKKQVKNELKRKYLVEFKRVAQPTAEYYGEFYKVTKIINNAFKTKQRKQQLCSE